VRIGSKVDFRKRLGRGPCGHTYAAQLGRHEVAVKVLSRNIERYPKLVSDVADAVRHTRDVLGEGAVRPYGFAVIKDRKSLVFEFFNGVSLARVLREYGLLEIDRSLQLMLQIVGTLEEAAAAGLVHGDLRPEKVLVSEDGRVKVADFGMAEATCVAAGYRKLGLRVGHPHYLAPELVDPQAQPSQKSDLYALGIMLFELAAGHRPYQGSDVSVVLQHSTEELPPLPSDVAGVSGLQELVVRLTAKSAADRPRDFRACREEIELILAGNSSVGPGFFESQDPNRSLDIFSVSDASWLPEESESLTEDSDSDPSHERGLAEEEPGEILSGPGGSRTSAQIVETWRPAIDRARSQLEIQRAIAIAAGLAGAILVISLIVWLLT